MTIVIIEDEALAAEKLQRTLLEVAPGSHVVATLASVEDAVIWFKTNAPPDLIFSDIQLLDGLSFEIFQRVSIHQPVVFTTAYDQYAIRAFEVNSIDYLLKPVQQEKLKQSLEKFRTVSKVAAKPNDFEAVLKYLKGSQDQYKSRFMVRIGQKIVAIPIEKIAYFYSENKLTYIVNKEGKRFPFDQTLEELLDVLDPKLFFRINRQYIVTFDCIAEMHPYFKGRIKLVLQPKTEEDVVISAERTPEFKKWIDQ
jgi:two-component system, LytTR family, response regulator LytT